MMRRREFALIAGSGVLTAIAGCASNGDADTSNYLTGVESAEGEVRVGVNQETMEEIDVVKMIQEGEVLDDTSVPSDGVEFVTFALIDEAGLAEILHQPGTYEFVAFNQESEEISQIEWTYNPEAKITAVDVIDGPKIESTITNVGTGPLVIEDVAYDKIPEDPIQSPHSDYELLPFTESSSLNDIGGVLYSGQSLTAETVPLWEERPGYADRGPEEPFECNKDYTVDLVIEASPTNSQSKVDISFRGEVMSDWQTSTAWVWCSDPQAQVVEEE